MSWTSDRSVWSVCMSCFTVTDGCGGSYIQDSGTIDYPLSNSYYGNDKYCVWHLQLPYSGNRIAVDVTEFDLEHVHDCIFDSLQVNYYTHMQRILFRIITPGISFLPRSTWNRRYFLSVIFIENAAVINQHTSGLISQPQVYQLLCKSTIQCMYTILLFLFSEWTAVY